MFKQSSLARRAAGLFAAALLLQASRSVPHPKPEPRQTPQSITATILRLEQRLDEAESRHQVAAVDELIADDYSGITVGGGIITKQDVLAAVAGKEQASSQSTDRRVRPLDSAAIYTALVVDRGIDPKTGEPYLLMTRVMDIWQKRGRDWKLVNDQATPVPFDHLARSLPVIQAPPRAPR
jgi:hypothetical protein